MVFLFSSLRCMWACVYACSWGVGGETTFVCVYVYTYVQMSVAPGDLYQACPLSLDGSSTLFFEAEPLNQTQLINIDYEQLYPLNNFTSPEITSD